MDVSYQRRLVPMLDVSYPEDWTFRYQSLGRFVPKGWSFRTHIYLFFIFLTWYGRFVPKHVPFIQPYKVWSSAKVLKILKSTQFLINA